MDDTAFDNLCERFDASWKEGHPMRIEDLLRETPAEQHGDYLTALLEIELEYRLKDDDSMPEDDYLKRFPEAQQQVLAAFESTRKRIASIRGETLPPTEIPQ